MFGYVRPYKPELKLAEYDTYKAVYCGLCKQLGRSFGPLARLTLSYDFAFLALLGMAVTPDKPDIKRQACAFNPVKRCPCCQQNPQLEYAADVAMLLLYHKLRDNLQDEGLLKRVGSWLMLLRLNRPYHKAALRQPEVAAAAQEAMRQQAKLEAERCSSIDQASEPTATALAKIFTQLSDQPTTVRVLERMGYFLGRYIYLIDALDDIEKDLKNNNYNPFVLRYGLKQGDAQSIAAARSEAKGGLYMTIAQIGSCYDLLELQRLQGVLSNVVYLGLRNSVDAIILQAEGSKRDERPLSGTGCVARCQRRPD